MEAQVLGRPGYISSAQKLSNTKIQKRGRPCKGSKRGIVISLRLTWEEYKRLQACAGKGKVSEYIRTKILR
jgi:hypothetical protein